MWILFAIMSAIFAALTSILAKVGIDGVNSNLATAVRTVVVVAMSWGMVFLTNAQGGLVDISRKSWLFLILSGLATGASWLCYYKAMQIGEVSKVVAIDKLSVVITLILAFVFLHEQQATTITNATDAAIIRFIGFTPPFKVQQKQFPALILIFQDFRFCISAHLSSLFLLHNL